MTQANHVTSAPQPANSHQPRSIRGKKNRYIAGAFVIAIALAIYPYATWPVFHPGHIEPPPADATPEMVVRAFLEAANVGDRDTAATLMPDVDHFDGVVWKKFFPWIHDRPSFTNIEVRSARISNSLGPGSTRHEVQVHANFDATNFDIPSYKSFSFLLDQSQGGRWTIVGYGI